MFDSPRSLAAVDFCAGRRASRGGSLLVAACLMLPLGPLAAQEPATGGAEAAFPESATEEREGAAERRERAIAERFLQVLLRRPRPGTALDRVYGYHVQSGSLDEFLAELDVTEEAAEAGAKQMIRGLLLAQRGQHAKAAEALIKAERLRPDDHGPPFYLARNLMAVGKTRQAAEALQRSIERDPPRTEAVEIYTALGRLHGRAGQRDQALEVWEQLEAQFPGDPNVGGRIARTLAGDGHFQAARERFEQLAKTARRDDDRIAFAVQAAEMRRRLGDSEAATAELEAILGRLRPGSWLYRDVRERLEAGFLQAGDHAALAEYYSKKLAETPDDVALRIRLGQVLIKAQRLDEAAEQLREAAQRSPSNEQVRLTLADVLVQKDDFASAAKQYERLAELDPDNPDYLMRWGQLLLEDTSRERAERRRAAAEVWQRLADARDRDAVMLAQVADRMRQIERQEEALALYRKAIEVAPESPQYREYLGEYLHRLGRDQEAMQAWRSIAEGPRRNRDSLIRLAEVLQTFEKTEPALKAWTQAAALDLNFEQYLRYARRLRDAERFDQAETQLQAAEPLAETPDQREQLWSARIATYQQAGTLNERIASLQRVEPTVDHLRQLAMMHAAAGQLTAAAAAIDRARQQQPESPGVLLVAAEIAERQDRFADAAELFQRLAELDSRFRTNHLKRVASLQMRLGQTAAAMETCNALIDANPASPESYQFLARLAFDGGRDDRGFAALRRAMRVAPRDNGPRRMLAAALAERFRTREAIELYLQALRYERELDDRIALVRTLAPLYDRQGELAGLVHRLRERGREDPSPRATQLMVSAAYETVEDYGRARQPIDSLLADHPRDVSLLKTAVRLSEAMGDLAGAAGYQERIVALAGTPENRYLLAQLQLDAGLIDVRTALREHLALADNPSRLGAMIRSALGRNEAETAKLLCEEAIRQDPTLWDVQLTLAQLLLHEARQSTPLNTDPARGEFKPQQHRAIALADQVRSLEVPLDAPPPTGRRRGSGASGGPSNANADPRRWTSYRSTLARYHRVGRYRDQIYYSSNSRDGVVDPYSFGHARVIAVGIEMLVIAQEAASDAAAAEQIKKLIDNKLPPLPADQIDDPAVLWERRALQAFASYMAPRPTSERTRQQRRRDERLTWRLAELDPEGGGVYLRQMLKPKAQSWRLRPKAAQTSGGDVLQPFDDEQLELVMDLYRRARADAEANPRSPSHWSALSDYRVILSAHFGRAGDDQRAAEFELRMPGEQATLPQLVAAIDYVLSLDQVRQADALVPRLLPAARRQGGGSGGGSGGRRGPSGTAGHLRRAGKHGDEFVRRHRLDLLDAVIAHAVGGQRQTRGAGQFTGGTLDTYVRSKTGGFYSLQVTAPLSSRLLTSAVVDELSSLLPPATGSAGSRKLNVSEDLIVHLAQPLSGASPAELKTRGVLSAFASWWAEQPRRCYQQLVRLCETFPEDVDLRIERARLASELGQSRVALRTLDSFEPLDSRMLVRKEMAALNLATRLGDRSRAEKAAERLFGVRMDTEVSLLFAERLKELGMNDKAAAVLQRLRQGRRRDERTQLQIAEVLIENENGDAAAEMAYTLLKRLGSGRSGTNNTSYYRNQAVSILQRAGRLEPLIEQAERRVEAAPDSSRAVTELAELYEAAGRKEEAQQQWQKLAESQPENPQQLLRRARSLFQNRQYKPAAELYLQAFQRDPQLMNRYAYELTRSVSEAGDAAEMYRGLTKIAPGSLQSYRVDEFLRVERQTPYSQAKRRFIVHVLKNPRVRQNLYRLLDDLPVSEQQAIPEVREAIIQAVCDDDAFSPQSTLWRVTSRSSGGTARGPLKQILDLLRSDAEARRRFLQAAEQARQDPDTKPSADLLVAMLEVDDEEKRPAAIETIRPLVAPGEQGDAQATSDADAVTISGGLLWQAGQLLEKVGEIDDRSQLLVAVYRRAARDPRVETQDMRFAVGARLVNALAQNGQKLEARQYLLDTDRKCDFSARNQHNPGYGDYQTINCRASIAETLKGLGYPVDALGIYQQLLSDPAAFKRARRWGSSLRIERTREAAEKVVDEVSPAAAADYLDALRDGLSQRQQMPAIEWMTLSLEAMMVGEAKPASVMAVEAAASTEAGRESLGRLEAALRTREQSGSDHWSWPASRLLIALHVAPEQLEAVLDELMKALPPQEELHQAAGTAKAVAYGPLTDLYALASAAAASEHAEAEAVTKVLAGYLQVVAETVEDPNFELALLAIGGEGPAAMRRQLDAIAAKKDEESLLSPTQVEVCLRIADLAVAEGDWATAARALELGLGDGPPIEASAEGGDAFALRSNAAGRQPEEGRRDRVTERLLEVIERCAQRGGVTLTTQDTTPVTAEEASPVDRAQWRRLQQALQAIVLPADRPGAVFPYAIQLASTSSHDRYSSRDDLTPRSAAIALARVTARVGQSETLFAVLRRRGQAASAGRGPVSLMVQLGLASGDADLMSEAIERFEAAVDADLPAAETPDQPRPNSYTVSSQLEQASFEKSELVDVMLQTLVPLVGSSALDDEALEQRVETLFKRTERLIVSDPYTASRHREIARRIRTKVLGEQQWGHDAGRAVERRRSGSFLNQAFELLRQLSTQPKE